MANKNNEAEVIIDKWKRELILGSGGFGVVSLWKNNETNERIALKQCRWSSDNTAITQKHKDRWKQEVDIMNRMNHPSVVKAVKIPEALVTKSDLPILGMEYCSGGDLRKVLNKTENCCGLPEDQVRQILKQIASAIEYLHSLRIIHRDLKPENVVLQPQTGGKILYKLIDLGYAKELDQSSLCSSFVGTLQYLAPELFTSKQYSSAVDNWSFGLLAHETITGKRPFLPNMSPAQWIPLVANKTSSDICAYVEQNGKVIFSKEISSFNQISSSLKYNMENWLRMVLEWNPKQRGGKFAFQFLAEILNLHIVHVFVFNSLEIFSYEINEDTKLIDLNLLIESNTSISCDNQHLILPRGLMPVEEVGKQIINNWYRNNEGKCIGHPITIFLFDNSKIVDYNAYSVCVIPPSVEQIMLNPTQLITFEEQKTSWRHAVWVAQQAIKKYNYLHEGVKLLLSNCINFHGLMQRTLNKLNVEFNKLLAVAQFFKCGIKFNLEQCEKQKIFSSFLRSLKDSLNELKEIYNMQESVGQLFTKSQTITSKFIEYQKSSEFVAVIKSKPIEDSLADIYSNILLAYDTLRRKSKEERSKRNDNQQMVKLLCDCFQLEESLMRNIYVHLRRLIDFYKQIETNNRQLESSSIIVMESQQKLNSLQMKVQKDLWQSLEPRKSCNNLVKKLSETSISTVASDELVNENETLLKNIDDIISDFVSVNHEDVECAPTKL